MAQDIKEPIHDIAHIGRVELLTPRPEKSLWYFKDLLGMEVVHERGSSVYLRGYGDYAASTLKPLGPPKTFEQTRLLVVGDHLRDAPSRPGLELP